MSDKTPHFRSRTDYLRDHMQANFRFSGEVTFFYDKHYVEARVTLDTKNERTFYGEAIFMVPHEHKDETGEFVRVYSEQMALTRAMREALHDAELYLAEQKNGDLDPCCPDKGNCAHTALPGETFTEADRAALDFFLNGFARNEEDDECDACHCEEVNEACTCGKSKHVEDDDNED